MNTFVPGANLINGRWEMPEPQDIARHFNSAGSKAKYFKLVKDNVDDPDFDVNAAYRSATHVVPVYRGYDAKTMKYFDRQAKRARRNAQIIAQAGVEVAEDELTR